MTFKFITVGLKWTFHATPSPAPSLPSLPQGNDFIPYLSNIPSLILFLVDELASYSPGEKKKKWKQAEENQHLELFWKKKKLRTQ